MQSNQQADSLSVQISKKLANLTTSSKSYIFKVHKQLRRINEKAYEPEIIAIGPYHHGKPNLKMMEEHKLRYLKHLLEREGKDNADEYILALRPLESVARTYYAESIKLKKDEFIEMMLLDGCFVMEVILKFELPLGSYENDPIFEMEWMAISLLRDLMLFENQLPFFVLCKLFDLIKVPDNHKSFMKLALQFFGGLLPGSGYLGPVDASSDSNIKHLLGLMHRYWLPSYGGSQEPQLSEEGQLSKETQFNGDAQLIEEAQQDEEAGVKIKRSQQDSHIKLLLGLRLSNWLPSIKRSQSSKKAKRQLREEAQLNEGRKLKTRSIWFLVLLSFWKLESKLKWSQSSKKAQEEKYLVPSATELQEAGVKIKKAERGSLFDITFENGTILVPPLDINDGTETFLRNLIVYEQYNPHIQSYITSYICFMDCLIDSLNDVEILCRCNIFNSCIGEKEAVRDLFNKLGDEVVAPRQNIIYANIITKINEHCRKRRYKWLAKLNRDYFNGPWAIISVVAAFVLLVLTSVQTFFAVFPRSG